LIADVIALLKRELASDVEDFSRVWLCAVSFVDGSDIWFEMVSSTGQHCRVVVFGHWAAGFVWRLNIPQRHEQQWNA